MTLDAHDIGPNIIALPGVRPGQPVNAARLAEGYWSALCRNGHLPNRSDVHPRALGDVLSHVFILERIAPGLARFRVAGSELTQLAGMDVRGMPISTFFHTTGRRDIAAALEACFDGPARVEATLTARNVQRGPDVQGQMLLLPLRSDMGRIDRCLGTIQMSGPLVSDTYRLVLDDCQVQSVFQTPRHSVPARAVPAPPLPVPSRERRLELVYDADQL